MVRRLFVILGLLVWPFAALADSHDAKVDRMMELLRIDELLVVMQAEGLSHGDDIAANMFPGRETSPEWLIGLSQLYDTGTMYATIRQDFGAALDGADIDGMIAFFESETGSAAVAYELSAREALLDDAIDEAARAKADEIMAGATPRYQQVQRFIQANDLVESNVMGAMNSNYSFYLGLVDAGAMDPSFTQEQILTEVWSQEEETRTSTDEWLRAFLNLAYTPMTDAELDAYIEFSLTTAGQQLNRALFAGFDPMFDRISYGLGLLSGKMAIGSEL